MWAYALGYGSSKPPPKAPVGDIVSDPDDWTQMTKGMWRDSIVDPNVIDGDGVDPPVGGDPEQPPDYIPGKNKPDSAGYLYWDDQDLDVHQSNQDFNLQAKADKRSKWDKYFG